MWTERVWQDLQPTPGRLNSSLRIVLASALTLICLLVWQMPFASIVLYFVLLVGRDSPAVSLRSGLFSIATIGFAVATELAVVILFDNDPAARVLSVAIVAFLAGMLTLSTTLGPLPSTWGFIFCTVIALWENNARSNALVETSLWLIAGVALAVGWSVAVEYIFATRDPASVLQEQRMVRYRSLLAMFSLIASGGEGGVLRDAVMAVARLAIEGQDGMQRLYNALIERNLERGNLPLATRVRITMLAQLMDVAAAFGTNSLLRIEEEEKSRCAAIAVACSELSRGVIPRKPMELPPADAMANPTLLDRVEWILHNISSMPDEEAVNRRKELVAQQSSEVPILIPGAFRNKATAAFALKLSLCATLCYIFYHAVGWPGISTSVITVFVAGLTTTGAIKQRLVFRLLGSAIGGLIFGLGAEIFLFPHMDSVTSLVILVSAIALLAAWCAAGRRFNYIGLQIAFAFYLVAFEGPSAPTNLAPPRDRLIGIIVALIVMAIVFDLIWPVRTVTAMRRNLATVLDAAAQLLRLMDGSGDQRTVFHKADALRDRIGKTIAALRTQDDVLDYDFGRERQKDVLAGQAMVRAAFTTASIFWNQFSILHHEQDAVFLTDTNLIAMRRELAQRLEAMAESIVQGDGFPRADLDSIAASDGGKPRFAEYSHNTVRHYQELERIVGTLPAI